MGITPGKLLILGEHAAVYGHPAIGIPLDKGIRVDTSDEGTGFQGVSEEHFPLLRKMIKTATGRSWEHDPDLKISADLPIGTGLGSSAALSVALVKHLTDLQDRTEVWERSHEVEKLIHGNPSGIDTGLCVWEHPLSFHFKGEELPQARPVKDFHPWLVAAALPRAGSTKNLVAAVSKKMRNHDPQTRKDMDKLGRLSQDLIVSASRITPVKLGRICEEAHILLSNMGLSTPDLDAYLNEAKTWGSLGGKMSGAGGGGAFFTIHPGRESAESAVKRCTAWFQTEKITLTMDPFILHP